MSLSGVSKSQVSKLCNDNDGAAAAPPHRFDATGAHDVGAEDLLEIGQARGLDWAYLSRSSNLLSERHLSFAEREEIAILRSKAQRAGNRTPAGATAVHDLPRAGRKAATRSGS